VARADADDLNLPHRFETQARALVLAPHLDILGSAILEVDREEAPLAIRRLPSEPLKIRRFLMTRNPFNHMTVVFRHQAVVQAGGYPGIHLKEDYGLWCRLAAQGASMGNLPDILVKATAGRDMYRRRGGWKYAKAEVDLQRFMVDLRLKSSFAAVIDGALRATVFLLPAFLRGGIYKTFLRSKHKK
jgi:hypothetical protein